MPRAVKVCFRRPARASTAALMTIPHDHRASLARGESEQALAGRRARQQVGLALLVLAEREHWEAAPPQRVVRRYPLLAFVVAQGPDVARDVVGVEVQPFESRHLLAAVDVAAGDRLADVVVIFPDRLDHP